MRTSFMTKVRHLAKYSIFLFLVTGLGVPIGVMAQLTGTAEERYPNTHKITVYKNDSTGIQAAKALNPVQVFEYPDRKVYIVEDSNMKGMTFSERKAFSMDDDMNKIFLRDRVIDTTRPIPSIPQGFRAAPDPETQQLYLIHFAGPIKGEWLDIVQAQGPVKYLDTIPSNAKLIQTDMETAEKMRGFPFVQWVGHFEPAYKMDPSLKSVELRGPLGGQSGSNFLAEDELNVTIQFVDHVSVKSSITAVKSKAKRVLKDVWTVGPYKNLRIVISPDDLQALAAIPDVVNIERWVEPVLFGERQGQIMANQLNAIGSQLSSPGYLAWLNSLGFDDTFDFVVNVSDSGFDRGQTTVGNVHQDFLDQGGASRIAYVQEVTGATIDVSAANNIDTGGHGTIDHAIVGGFNNSSGNDFEDASGYHFGLGIAPFVQLGSSRIFNPNFTFPDHTELTNAAYAQGARISSNSWGSTVGTGQYDATSQEYDRLVRDARPATASDGGESGNQEMVIVWAAGNRGRAGASTLGDRGATANNTLVVAASENDYPVGVDGCLIGNSGADDARDIIDFSSQGPNADGRFGPHIAAPGTHIQGAASQDPGYIGDGVCDGSFPVGNTLYAWSSGTSHSTPAVAGASALLRQWFVNQTMPVPSPAMTKAYLMNSGTYMTGVGANDDLPSNTQGMGRLNLERMFDNTPRMLVDQTHMFDGTGDTPFELEGQIATNTDPFRVTLVWTDAPGSTVGNAWVNDLDLIVTLDDGSGPVDYQGNNFLNDQSQPGGAPDGQNNVESVWLPSGTTGSFTVTVRASNIPGDGVPNQGDTTDQDFALVVYNAKEKRATPRVMGFHYAAKVVCGIQRDREDMRLARGIYGTAINIHNPGEKPVTFDKTLALTFPPKEQRPGKVLRIATDTLGPGEALAVDCPDIQQRLFPNGFPTSYIKGFVVIESSASVNVTGVYSAMNLQGENPSIDVEQIRERRTRSGMTER
ncbi:S8 family serine peptidase [Nitrospira sp. M1]